MTEHGRMPYSLQVEFRTPSSFLVAYSVNLSRGGLFIETDVDIPSGAYITVDFGIPTAGQVSLNGTVSWDNQNVSPLGRLVSVAVTKRW
jgi:uncharacterized protein (TIGR02266 family)